MPGRTARPHILRRNLGRENPWLQFQWRRYVLLNVRPNSAAQRNDAMCQIRKSTAEVASSNHTDADSGVRSLIQIKLALIGTALFDSSESGISNRLR